MPHDIDRILAGVANGVWLIDPDKAREIISVLALRAGGGQTLWSGEPAQQVYASEPLQGRRGPVHVLKLHGTIMPRSGMMSQMSGGASLEQFQKAFGVAAQDETAQAIVLDVDSPGGSVEFVPETAEMVYRARRAGRPIVAVSNTTMASAAYFIASAADEIVVTPSGMIGSIGVYTMHDDLSEALKARGISRSLIKEGPRKAEGAIGALDEAARAHIQAFCADAYDLFVKAVAKHRGVPVATVRADPEKSETHMGGGRAYAAREGVRLGLADRVATLEETLARVSTGDRTTRTRVARARLSLT
jgi:signal peptide peptidase SppA